MMLFIVVMAYFALCAECSGSPPGLAPAETPEFLGPAYPIAAKVVDALSGKAQGKNGTELNDD